jgi:hypothetical protein
MALKILIAGCPSDEKGSVETVVKGVLGTRPAAEHWSVSLVRLGKQWSVTLDGPGARAVAFMSTDVRLREALTEALPAGAPGAPIATAPASHPAPMPSAAAPARAGSTSSSAPVNSPPPAASRSPARSAPAISASNGGERRDPHSCENCREGFIVVYESGDDESQEVVPVACPHCWHINRVFVTLWAATGRDYRAEKA